MKIRKVDTRYNYNGGIPKQIDCFTIQQNYSDWVLNIPNNKIASPRKHAQRRIIIATIQLKLKTQLP